MKGKNVWNQIKIGTLTSLHYLHYNHRHYHCLNHNVASYSWIYDHHHAFWTSFMLRYCLSLSSSWLSFSSSPSSSSLSSQAIATASSASSASSSSSSALLLRHHDAYAMESYTQNIILYNRENAMCSPWHMLEAWSEPVNSININTGRRLIW